MRALVALPLLGLVLAGCAKGPGGLTANPYTRLTFTVTMAGNVNPNYYYLVAIRPIFDTTDPKDSNGPVGVYTTTTGNPKNGLVTGRPTRMILYDPTVSNSYRVQKFGTRATTPEDDNPIDLAQVSDVGVAVQGDDPQTSGFPTQLKFTVYTSDLVDDATTAQKINLIEFNIIACNKRLLTSGDASNRVADALGNINNLGISGQGYASRFINTSVSYTNAQSSDPETANDEYRPSSNYDPTVDIVDWNLDVARP